MTDRRTSLATLADANVEVESLNSRERGRPERDATNTFGIVLLVLCLGLLLFAYR